MPDATKLELQRQMGIRLSQIREALDLTQSALGEVMMVGTTTVAGWESGRNMLDVVALGHAATMLGFSTDFVILGDIGSLPFDLAVRIQAIQRASAGETTPRRRGRPTPRVNDVPDQVPPPAKRTLHQPRSRYVPPPKNT